MRILIQSDDGPDVEVHVHANGTATVRVDFVCAGSARWEKEDNCLRLRLPSGVFHRRDDGPDGLSFDFEDR